MLDSAEFSSSKYALSASVSSADEMIFVRGVASGSMANDPCEVHVEVSDGTSWNLISVPVGSGGAVSFDGVSITFASQKWYILIGSSASSGMFEGRSGTVMYIGQVSLDTVLTSGSLGVD